MIKAYAAKIIMAMMIWEGNKRKVFARGPIFGGSCILKSLPLKDSPITRVLEVARRMKRARTGARSIRNCRHCVNSGKTGKIWVKICVNRLE